MNRNDTSVNPTSSITSTAPRPADAQRARFSRLALPLAATALALSACNVNIDFDEESVSQTFELDTFTDITVEAPFEVTIREGDTQSVSVEVGESLVDDLIVEVIDGQLRIDIESSSFNIGRDLVATITVTDLDALHASSASDIVVVNIDADHLDIQTDTASQVSVSGSIETLTLDMSEASQTDFAGTTIGAVNLEMSGASSADFPSTVDAISGSIRSASSLDVDNATDVRVDTSGASSIDRN